jgi:hypothetical protein
MAAHFLQQLPQVPNHELTPDSECIICQEPYGTSVDGTVEIPVRLPCQHIVGNVCIDIWLSPTKEAKNTCPYCRAVFFPTQNLSEPEPASAFAQDFNYIFSRIGASPAYRRLARLGRHRRERQLYQYLRSTGVELPPLVLGEWRFTPTQDEVLVAELERRGAFAVRYFEQAFEYWAEWLDNRGFWSILREQGFVYQPRMPQDGPGLVSEWNLGIEGLPSLLVGDVEEDQG